MDLEEILAMFNSIGSDIGDLLNSMPNIDGLDYCTAYAWFSSFGDPYDENYDDPFEMFNQILESLWQAWESAMQALENYVTPEDGLGAANQAYDAFGQIDYSLSNLRQIIDY